MPITVQSIHDIPANAIRTALQADGSVLAYLPGDTLPPPPPPGPPPVQQSITKRQLYLALMELAWFGSTMDQINAQINALLDQLPNPPRERARTEFFTSRDYLRGHALLNAMVTSPPLSKTQADLDMLFTLGATFAPE